MSTTTQRALDAVRGGGAVLALDTNCVVGRHEGGLTFPGMKLVASITHVRELGHALRVVVPAVVHFEVLHDLRLHMAAREQGFDETIVSDGLRSKGVDVESFEPIAASAQIFRWYPTDEEWQAAKSKRPATIDWLIASEAAARSWVLVTRDKGKEFEKVPRRVTPERLRALLDELQQALQTKGPAQD